MERKCSPDNFVKCQRRKGQNIMISAKDSHDKKMMMALCELNGAEPSPSVGANSLEITKYRITRVNSNIICTLF